VEVGGANPPKALIIKMVKIQLDVPEELNKKLGIYKIQNNLITKADAMIKICEEKLK